MEARLSALYAETSESGRTKLGFEGNLLCKLDTVCMWPGVISGRCGEGFDSSSTNLSLSFERFLSPFCKSTVKFPSSIRFPIAASLARRRFLEALSDDLGNIRLFGLDG